LNEERDAHSFLTRQVSLRPCAFAVNFMILWTDSN